MLTLADLGVLRAVSEQDGRVVVAITPTYTGCPAMDTMRDDLEHALLAAGYADVEIRTRAVARRGRSDWITASGGASWPRPASPRPARRHGGRPDPADAGARPARPSPARSAAVDDTEELSRFSATACKALRRCRSCREPFEHVKEI